MKRKKRVIIVREGRRSEGGVGKKWFEILERKFQSWGIGLEYLPIAAKAKRAIESRHVGFLVFISGKMIEQARVIKQEYGYRLNVLLFTARPGKWVIRGGVFVIDKANPRWEMIERIVNGNPATNSVKMW